MSYSPQSTHQAACFGQDVPAERKGQLFLTYSCMCRSAAADPCNRRATQEVNLETLGNFPFVLAFWDVCVFTSALL